MSYLALLLADGRLPVGAHTQSAGVEPALVAGMRLDQGPEYARARLRTVTEVEAAAAVGMTSMQSLRLVEVPQALIAMLPSLLSQFVVILKDSALGYLTPADYARHCTHEMEPDDSHRDRT